MTDKLREIAQQALEALEALLAVNDNYSPFGGEIQQDRIDRAWDNARATIAALRSALAEDSMQRLTDVQQEIEQGLFFDAVYEAWHSAGMDVLGGDWNTFAKTLEAKLKETK